MQNQEQYERALARAKAENIVICGDSIAPNGDRAWSVFNPKYEYQPDHSWYTVRLAAGSQHYTCNCAARVLICKHIACVMDDQATRKSATPPRYTADSLYAARHHNPFTIVSLWSSR